MIILDASVVVKWFSEEAFYIALAKETELTFITADRGLYEGVRNLDFVKFIGEI